MSATSPRTATLPVLRPDIEFHPGPDEADGSPTYVIHDPLRGTFEKATWVQAEVLRRLRTPLTVAQLHQMLSDGTTINVCAEDIVQLCADASARGLTRDSCVADQETWETHQKQPRSRDVANYFRRLVFLRIPLITPDAFLEQTIRFVRPLGSQAALLTYLCVALIGVILLAQQFDAYLATFPYFFNIQGAVAFALAIVVVKVIHEFSHAYVAKALGNRVPTMGVALIFLFPVAYADVTDSWRMRSRRKRLLISLAGMLAELVIAGFALLVWALSPPGLPKSVCFVVSSVTLLSTLLVNLNPAMRFDGYYLLSDLLGFDNLQSRSFAMTRWALRRHVLGMKLDSPEPALPSRRAAVMVAYALGAWIYRLFLYVAIALMLYHRVTKVIGAALFFLAVYAFLVKPVVTEVVSVLKMRQLLSWNPRTLVATGACGAVFLWAALPLPRREAAPAVTVARASQIIYAPCDGVLRELDIGPNSRVYEGQTLFVLESEELHSQARLARLEIERVGIELAVIEGDEDYRQLLPQKREELARAQAKLESVLAAIDGNRVTAKVDGVVVEWDESVRDGTPIGSRQILGKILDQRRPTIKCYLRHGLAPDVAVHDRVHFCSDAQRGRLAGVVSFVTPVRADLLEHRGLSSATGGDIAVIVDAQGRHEIVDCYYAVEVTLDSPLQPLRVGQTGRVWVRTEPRSRLADLLRYGYSVLVRESSF